MNTCRRGCGRFPHFGPCQPSEGAPVAPTAEERAYRVSYTIDVEAESAQLAAKKVAALLSRPGVPGRGSYQVREHPKWGDAPVTIDLGEGEW